MKEPSKEQIKEPAKFLRQVLKEKHKIDLPHGHALEVLAKVFGFNDWNTASALTPKIEPKSIQEKPRAAKITTIGEAIDFLSSFERSTKLVVNEYHWNKFDHLKDLTGPNTSVCTLTYDAEIQTGKELVLELNTENELNYEVQNFGKSSKQTFDKTTAGRSQRRIKYLQMQNSFWNKNYSFKSNS